MDIIEPRDWSVGMVPSGFDDLDFRGQSSLLQDRFARGGRLCRELRATRWWRFVHRRQLKKRIYILRDEYRTELARLIDLEIRSRMHTHVVQLDAQELISREHRARLRAAETYGGPSLTSHDQDYTRPVIVPVEVPMPTDYTNDRDSTPAPSHFEGHNDGHGFGGAGASGSWDSDSSGSSSSCDTSSSFDSGGDCGGSSSND